MHARYKEISALPPGNSDNFHRVKRVHSFSNQLNLKNRRLLDIGAGIGIFPASMAELGWDVTAIEPDKRTVEHLRINIGVTAIAEDLFGLDSHSIGVFDLVSLNKVLEHLERPVAFLRHAASLLSHSGFIYVELPDIAAADESIYREEFFIEHHHIFSPASFSLLANNAGLSVRNLERISEPSGKYTLCGYLTK